MHETLELLRRSKVTTIYRGLGTEECLRLTEALYTAGLRSFEVTMNSPDPFAAITALRKEFGTDVGIGAGTVLEPAEVDRVAEAGGQFVISPDTEPAVIGRTKETGLVSIPGAFTPTEVTQAVRAGADLVKVFPISAVGAGYIKQLRGPLSTVEFMATGGVDPELARDCFANGCTGVGVGTAAFGVGKDGGFDAAELHRKATAFLEATGYVPG